MSEQGEQQQDDMHAVDVHDLIPEGVEPLDMTPIPTVIEGEVITREMPSEFGGMFTLSGVDNLGTQVVSRDPRRRSVTILGIGADIRVGRTQAACRSSTGMRWPGNVPLVVTACDQLWAAPYTSGTTVDISVAAERWT